MRYLICVIFILIVVELSSGCQERKYELAQYPQILVLIETNASYADIEAFLLTNKTALSYLHEIPYALSHDPALFAADKGRKDVLQLLKINGVDLRQTLFALKKKGYDDNVMIPIREVLEEGQKH